MIRQNTMLVKIDQDIMSEIVNVPGWGENKNRTINRLLKYALNESRKSRDKQLFLQFDNKKDDIGH